MNNNHANLMFYRYLDTISASRNNMMTMFTATMNTITEQERSISSLLYHYIGDVQNDENSQQYHNRERSATAPTSRNRQHVRTRGVVPPATRTPPLQTSDIWSAILNIANPPNFATADLLQPVVVRPTISQIQRATENIVYGDISNNSHTQCPISQEDFQPTDRVTRITQCGHIFFPNQIREWFRRNVRCPVCRFDIRNHVHRGNHPTPATSVSTGPVTSVSTGPVTSVSTMPAANDSTTVPATSVSTGPVTSVSTGPVTSVSTAPVASAEPPNSLTQLTQTISRELTNAFQNIAPGGVGDIIIEYGVAPDPSNNDYERDYGVD